MAEDRLVTSAEQMPTADEMRAAVEGADVVSSESIDELSYEERFRRIAVRSETDYTNLKALQDHYDHKNKWSHFLMGIMAALVGFQCFLLAMVGFGYWNFVAYKWLLPVLLVQNLGQVIGLAVFVVKALFKDMDAVSRPHEPTTTRRPKKAAQG